jgi:hypothetical protein
MENVNGEGIHQAVFTSACLPILVEALEGGITGLQKSSCFMSCAYFKYC